MKKYSLSLILLSLTLLIGCVSSDPTETLVKNYLARSMDVDANSISILEMEEAAPWMVIDSIEVLSDSLNQKKDEIIDHLRMAIESSLIAIEEAEETKNSGFRALEGIADETIQVSKETIKMAEAMIESMKVDYSGTLLEGLYNKIEHFKAIENDILFQVLNGKWAVEDGETHDFQLMANLDLSEIIGKFEE